MSINWLKMLCESGLQDKPKVLVHESTCKDIASGSEEIWCPFMFKKANFLDVYDTAFISLPK